MKNTKTIQRIPVKADKFGNEMFTAMYEVYRSSTADQFFDWCQEAVMNHSVSAKGKKLGFIEDLRKIRHNKDRVVQKMTHFFLAGEGLSVV